VAENKITRQPARAWNPRPKWFLDDKTCNFHSNERGHDIFKCPVLWQSIEGLIEQGYLNFSHAEAPNTIFNPLPGHKDPEVNTLSSEQVGEEFHEAPSSGTGLSGPLPIAPEVSAWLIIP
jgi:hypothetical protein